MKIITDYKNETNYRQNRLLDIKYLIIHHTAGKFGYDFLIGRGKTNIQVSFHYYISKEGKIYQFLDDNQIGYHTGQSNIGPVENIKGWGWNLNPISLGIELENLGNGKDEYTKEQINALEKLSVYLIKKYNVDIRNVLGHKEITTRKIDPSSNFYKDDMDGFRYFLIKEIKKENMKKENKKYENIKGFEIFENMEDNYETKKLIEIGIYRFVELLKSKKLKIRK